MNDTQHLKKGTLEYAYSEIDGKKYIIQSFGDIQQSYWANGRYYEEDMVRFIKENYSEKGGTFVDIGSSIGNYTMVFSQLADVVYSFEPITTTYFHQALNLLINKIDNVHMYNIGLGNECGLTNMWIDDLSKASGGGVIQEDGEYVINITKLDLFNIEDVRVMKIDIEGHEIEAMKGAVETIKKCKPDLFIECSTETFRQQVTSFLQSLDLGYKIYPQSFNNTPTYLFTVRDKDEFKKTKMTLNKR